MKTLLLIAITLMGTGCTITFLPTQTDAEILEDRLDNVVPETIDLIEVNF